MGVPVLVMSIAIRPSWTPIGIINQPVDLALLCPPIVKARLLSLVASWQVLITCRCLRSASCIKSLLTQRNNTNGIRSVVTDGRSDRVNHIITRAMGLLRGYSPSVRSAQPIMEFPPPSLIIPESPEFEQA